MKKILEKYITEKFKGREFWKQGKKLLETRFQKGTKYVVDLQNNKMVILLAAQTSSKDLKERTVSYRRAKGESHPIIDVRDKKVREIFEGVSHLQVTVFEDKIEVEGYVQEGIANRKKRVSDISDLLKVKRKGKVIFSKNQLAEMAQLSKASGWDAFDIDSEIEIQQHRRSTNDTVISIQKALKHLAIPLTVASFFSGAGLIDFAFVLEKFQILYALEINKHAAETYRANIGDEIVIGDITKIDPYSVPKASVMIAGISCKPFSKTNRNKTRLEAHPDYMLTDSFIRAVEANDKCVVFMIENVEEFLTVQDEFFPSLIKERLPEFEYRKGVLNAVQFGDPQYRKRSFIIGTRKGLPPIELPEPFLKEGDYKTVKEAFEGLHSGIANYDEKVQSKKETIHRMSFVKQGGNWRDIPEHLCPKYQLHNYHYRLKEDAPSCTLVHPRKSLLTAPFRNAVLSYITN